MADRPEAKRPRPATSHTASAVGLDALPAVALSTVLTYSDLATLLSAEDTCRQFRTLIQSQGLRERLVHRDVVFSEYDEPIDDFEWRMLINTATQPIDYSTTLLYDVTGCSSVDRPIETPLNTLAPSACWLSMRSIPDRQATRQEGEPDDYMQLAKNTQIECGCETGEACYWSTTPSPDANALDFIDYTVAPKSLVRLLQVVPYRAFWHPDAPAYGPRAISFQFYSIPSSEEDDRELLYQSPVFPMENKMQLNEFMLSRPLWLPHGGLMRLSMHGRHQADTVDEPLWQPIEGDPPMYYTCLCYVGLLGVSSLHLQPPPVEQPHPTTEDQVPHFPPLPYT